jgi:DNA-binding NarL/FixJ family response regulator
MPLASSSARALVIDDLELVQTGFTQMLRRAGASTVESRHSSKADEVEPARLDLVVLGPHLCRPASELVASLREHGCAGRIVLLATSVARPEFVALLRSGIDAVAPFSSTEEGLTRLLGRVMAGERILDGVALEAVSPALTVATSGHPLSPRERQVLALLATHRTLAEVADELTVSLATVKSHTTNLYGKLGARSRREAVEVGFSRRILESVV